jgi:hypothetical protein
MQIALAKDNALYKKNMLKQKLFLIDNMLNRSKNSEKIKKSGNQQAIELLEQSSDFYLQAKKNINGHALDSAEKDINNALRSIDSAIAIINNDPSSTLVERSRYQQLLDGIQSLQKTLVDNSSKQDKNKEKLVKASSLAKGDKYTEANKILNTVYHDIVKTVSSGYKNKTEVVYSLNLDTPKDEYIYENKRYGSNLKLINSIMSKSQKKSIIKLATNYIQRAKHNQQLAGKEANNGEFTAAIKTIEGANKKLRQAASLFGIQF